MHYKGNHGKIRPAHKEGPRLQFPVIGNSAYFNGVGKKHYSKINNLSDKSLFNPEQLPEGWSSQLVGTPRKTPQEYQEDTLIKFQREFDHRKMEKWPQTIDADTLTGESLKKKPEAKSKPRNQFRKGEESFTNIFGPMEALYSKIHGLHNRSMVNHGNSYAEMSGGYSPKMVSPTFISSRLEGA